MRIRFLLNISSNMKQFLLLLIMLFSLSCTAQKAFKPVKTALKDKKYNEAITQIEKLRTDSTFKNNTKLCLYAIEAYRGLNDAENTKIYLKKNYDTLAFFSTTRELIATSLRLDSIENALQHETGAKPKQKHLVCSVLNQYYPNINAAARFYYSKKDYNNAMRFLRISIDLPHSKIGTLAKLPVKVDTTNSVLYLISAYNAKSMMRCIATKTQPCKPRARDALCYDTLHSTLKLKTIQQATTVFCMKAGMHTLQRLSFLPGWPIITTSISTTNKRST